jgi:hypothetical protein
MEIFIAFAGAIVTVCVIAGMVLITPSRSVPVRTSLDEQGDTQGSELSPRDRDVET